VTRRPKKSQIRLKEAVKQKLALNGIDLRESRGWPEILSLYADFTSRDISDLTHKPKEALLQAMENDGIWDERSGFNAVDPNPINVALRSKRSMNSLRKLPFAKVEPATKFQAEEFYKSSEWKKVRGKILHIYGLECMACSATPMTGAVMNVDHIRPVRKYWGKRLDLNNLQVLCSRCNRIKGSSSQIDLRPDIRPLRKAVAA